MADDNKRNVQYFEATSMRGLFDTLDTWQTENRKRFLSLNVQRDGAAFCCIALTNPTEVIIKDGSSDSWCAAVSYEGALKIEA